MYDIYDIVWGFPYTVEVQKAFNRAEGFPDEEWEEFDPYNLENEYGLFRFMYTGHVTDVTPGYFGISLDGGASWELDVHTVKDLEPTEEQKRKVKEEYNKLPQEVRDVSGPIDFYTVWSTS